jgi:malate dehydrogenase (oxaloacetate-decarboxylating)
VAEQGTFLDPLQNKGTAFSLAERTALRLHGLLPESVETIEQQLDRVYATYLERQTALHRHVNLRVLQDTNEVLFFRLVSEHLAEMLPVIYTPTVAEACQNFSHIYRRPRGLFLSYPARDRLREALRNRPQAAVDVIVVTDGERVLGIGDQGIGGMAIPIGKLALYTVIGGIDPAEYDAFIEQFVEAVQAELPDVLLQWEDFAIDHARPILERYRRRLLIFNDDIQGTAAVTLATVLAAADTAGTPLPEHRFLILGAGSAGTGVAEYLTTELIGSGLTADAARARFPLVDVSGLIHDGRPDLTPEQLAFAVPAAQAAAWAADGRADFATVMSCFDPTVLIGLSTAAGAFTEPLVRGMASRVRRPIILPLSNPSSRSEAEPADLLAWTDGRALVATGSPFRPVPTPDGPATIAQCNNAFLFPAMGLAAVAANATRVTDAMFLSAARALATCSPARRSPAAGLLPPVTELPQVADTVALAVAVQAVADGVAPRRSESELADRIKRVRWHPRYREPT